MLLSFLENNLLTIVTVVGTLLILIPENPISTDKKHILGMTSVALLILTFLDYYDYLLSTQVYEVTNEIQIRFVISSLTYVLRPLIVIGPIGLIIERGKLYLELLSLEGISVLIYILNFFYPIAFWYNEQGEFQRGPFGFTPHIIAIIYLIYFFYCSITNNGQNEFRRMSVENVKYRGIVYFIPIAGFIALVVASTGVENKNFRTLNPTIAICILLYYCYLQMQYVEEYDSMQKKHLKDARDALLVYQIKPHFLYNTLNVIYYLCQKDPEMAADAVDKFSTYLRENMEMGAEADRLISFDEEMNHVKMYADLEMLRFDNIRVEYDLQDKNFCLPAVTVQPMVENAIRHGVRNKENGVIRIRSFIDEDYHVILITDNGIGYKRKEALVDEPEHVGMGIANVKERISVMMGGSVDILMVRDVGTQVTIKIPMKKEL